jgi:hypothetical protein
MKVTLVFVNGTFIFLHSLGCRDEYNNVYALLQNLVTHFSANSIPRTRTASSVAWERATHLVCGSCKRKLEHVQKCLGAWVCLTQHSSDMLRPFRELNCRTLYVHYCTRSFKIKKDEKIAKFNFLLFFQLVSWITINLNLLYFKHIFEIITLDRNALLQSFNERLTYIKEIFQLVKIIAPFRTLVLTKEATF